MNKKDRKRIKEEIGDVFAECRNTLKLAGYNVWTLFPEDESYIGGNFLCVNLDYPYQKIYLHCSEELITSWDERIPANRKELLMHEAIHVLLWRLTEYGSSRYISEKEFNDEDERVSNLAKGIENRNKKGN